MIIDFSISNFRSIHQTQTLSFEATPDNHLEEYFIVNKGPYRLLKIAAILGANASGKSNILKAFYMLPLLMLKPAEDKTDRIKYDKFALSKDAANEYSQIKINFIVGDSKYRYEISFNNLFIHSELLYCLPFDSKREHKVFERETDYESMVSSLIWGDKYKSAKNTAILSANLLYNRTVFGSFMKSNVDIPWMKDIVDWIKGYFMPIVTTQNQRIHKYVTQMINDEEIDKEVLAEQLQKADVGINKIMIEEVKQKIPQNVTEFIMADPKIPVELKNILKKDEEIPSLKLKFDHQGEDGPVTFDYEMESRGTQRYFELSGLLLEMIKNPHFLAIDELECRLHPDLYQHFINSYLENVKNSQLIFSTHNREFLKDRDSFRDDIVWFTEKSEAGSTHLYSLADFDTKELRSVTSRYNAYVNGRLGAVPNIGDTHISFK